MAVIRGTTSPKATQKWKTRGSRTVIILTIFVFLFGISLCVSLSPYGKLKGRTPADRTKLSEEPDEDRVFLNEKGLLVALSGMETGKYMLDNMMTKDDAEVFRYEFYARHPEVTLCYSPRLSLLGYKKDSNICVGYRARLISEEGGNQKYEELLSCTEQIIDELKDEDEETKIREVSRWIRGRCSYTKHPNNMWDESLYGCLVKGTATCLGYSEGFLYMMDRLGVRCRIECTRYHAWNVVYDGRSWIKIDLTRD